MAQATASELKANLGKYLLLAAREEISITKNGREIAMLTAPKERHGWVDDITGIIPNADVNVKELRAERMAQKYESLD